MQKCHTIFFEKTLTENLLSILNSKNTFIFHLTVTLIISHVSDQFSLILPKRSEQLYSFMLSKQLKNKLF